MKSWAWKHLVAANYDTTDAINRAHADIAALTDLEHREIDRIGVARVIAREVKRNRLLIPANGGPADQLPLFAAVKDEAGRWMRVSYLLCNFDQLNALYLRESARAGNASRRVQRLGHDLELYAAHKDLPNLEAVWQAEHVEFRLEEAA